MSSFEASSSQAEIRFVPDPIGPALGFRAKDAASAEPGAAGAPTPEIDALTRTEAELAAEYERGLAEGRAAADADLESPIAALSEATRALAEQRTLYLHEQRGLLVELALSMAGKIVERELATDQQLLSNIVDRAIGRLDQESPIVVQLSSDDHRKAQSGEHPALGALTSEGDIALESSRELANGEARVVSGATTIEARIASMLERFGEELVDFDAICAPPLSEDDAS